MVDQIDEFDCIVIGSGFGGSVMSHKLAERGRKVLLLERGKAYAPGDFPRTPLGTSTNLWDPGQNLYGLCDLWSFKRFHAIVSSGLGGGSLIYANVMMRKPAAWFDDTWPVKRSDLDPHYEAVQSMLKVEKYPNTLQTEKTLRMREAALRAGLQWDEAPLAVAFSGPGKRPAVVRGRNRFDAVRTTCISCGQCDVGCNSGSKNSMDLTYLSSWAVRKNVRIETLHEVRRIRRLDDGRYEVIAAKHQPPTPPWDRSRPPVAEQVRFRALCVVLAAGSLGSTYLLLRNRVNLPMLSATLGTRFTGNADYLGFIRTRPQRVLDSSRAPVITSFFAEGMEATHRATAPNGSRHVVEDGGYPVLVDWFYEVARPHTVKRLARLMLALGLARWTRTSSSRVGALFADAIGPSEASRSLVPMLGMGQDTADGVMRLRNGELIVTWRKSSSRDTFDGIQATMKKVATALDAEFLEIRSTGISRMLTVHPLGGVPMGISPAHGVVDAHGEVYGYPGLFVADGSVVPGAVGVNPAFTIAALADLFSEQVDRRCRAGR